MEESRMTVVNVGHPVYGYRTISGESLGEGVIEDILRHYVDVTSAKYKGEFVQENIAIAERVMQGKRPSKTQRNLLWKQAVLGIAIATLPLFSATHAFAAGTAIDLAPIDYITNSAYWTLVKVAGYISLGVLAWIAYLIKFGGADPSKRTTAKVVFWSWFFGVGLLVGAPWAKNVVFGLWQKAFNLG
jgi:hypothetical protein